MIKRKDLAKWIEVDQYREGLKGAFVRVTYNKQYVLAMIDSFSPGKDSYKVEQRETKFQINLTNRGKTKQFKINLVSDHEPTESEFMRMRQENPKIPMSQHSIQQTLAMITEASKFMYDKDEYERLVKDQNYKQLRALNFNSLNMTSIKMTISGELAMAEAAFQQVKEANYNQMDDLRETYD